MKYLRDVLAAIGALATILLVLAAVAFVALSQNIAIQIGGEHNKIEQKNEPRQTAPNPPVPTAPAQAAPAPQNSPTTDSPPVSSTQSQPAPFVAPQQIAQTSPPQYQAALPARSYSRSYANTQYVETEEAEDCEYAEEEEVETVEYTVEYVEECECEDP